jgi:hypothetical protein
MSDDVRLGDRAAERSAALADFKLLEIAFLNLHS